MKWLIAVLAQCTIAQGAQTASAEPTGSQRASEQPRGIVLTCAYPQIQDLGPQLWLTQEGNDYVVRWVAWRFDPGEGNDRLENRVLGSFTHCKTAPDERRLIVCNKHHADVTPHFSFFNIALERRQQLDISTIDEDNVGTTSRWVVGIHSPERPRQCRSRGFQDSLGSYDTVCNDIYFNANASAPECWASTAGRHPQ